MNDWLRLSSTMESAEGEAATPEKSRAGNTDACENTAVDQVRQFALRGAPKRVDRKFPILIAKPRKN